MKQAILITGYKDVSSFIDIINFFGDNFNFYVHVDRKSNLDLSPLAKMDNVFCSNKYVVNWGGINHLKAILFLAGTALKNPENSFLHLITAEDYPTKTVTQFLELDQTKNYLDFFDVPAPRWEPFGGLDRIDCYNFYDLLNAKVKYQNTLIRAIRVLQRKLNIKRGFSEDFLKLKLYGGSTYWSLNREAVQYVLDFTEKNKSFWNRFKYTFCAEEFYFQTILLNSPYAGTLVNDNLRYIDWLSKGRGSRPIFLDSRDFDAIVSSNKFFARKIRNSEEKGLKSMLNEYLQEQAGKSSKAAVV